MGTCHSHGNISLYELQRKYKNKSHQVPEWQRGDVWGKSKQSEFEHTVREKSKQGKDILTGCVILYTTKENPTTTYISDGLQRTLNSGRIFEKLASEVGEVSAEEILERVTVPVLNMVYENDSEAKDEFRRINQGTPLTAREEARTILTDLQNYEDWNKRIFIPLHESMRTSINHFGIRVSKTKKKKDQHERDDYALFLRYLSDSDSEMTLRYSFDIKHIDNKNRRQSILEQKLVNKLESLGIDASEKQLVSFGKFIEQQGAFIKDIWTKIPKHDWNKEIQTITPTCFRWLLHLAIFRKNKSIPVQRFETFATKVLTRNHGSTNIQYADGSYLVMALADLTPLGNIQIKLDFIIDPTLNSALARKKKKTNQLLPGIHNAHVLPFSTNPQGDDGITVPIPATINMSMGAAPITPSPSV